MVGGRDIGARRVQVEIAVDRPALGLAAHHDLATCTLDCDMIDRQSGCIEIAAQDKSVLAGLDPAGPGERARNHIARRCRGNGLRGCVEGHSPGAVTGRADIQRAAIRIGMGAGESGRRAQGAAGGKVGTGRQVAIIVGQQGPFANVDGAFGLPVLACP